MKNINDIIELGNGDKYKIKSVSDIGNGVYSYQADKLTITGNVHKNLKGTLVHMPYSEIKLINRCKSRV